MQSVTLQLYPPQWQVAGKLTGLLAKSILWLRISLYDLRFVAIGMPFRSGLLR